MDVEWEFRASYELQSTLLYYILNNGRRVKNNPSKSFICQMDCLKHHRTPFSNGSLTCSCEHRSRARLSANLPVHRALPVFRHQTYQSRLKQLDSSLQTSTSAASPHGGSYDLAYMPTQIDDIQNSAEQFPPQMSCWNLASINTYSSATLSGLSRSVMANVTVSDSNFTTNK